MLVATAQRLGKITILHLTGPIVHGEPCSVLYNFVRNESASRTLVLDLAKVERIDAAGLGTLLEIRQWACASAIRLQLVNLPEPVERLLELTGLRRAFAYASVPDLLCLLYRATSPPEEADIGNTRQESPKVFVHAQDLTDFAAL
jgi:anti-anti-sigma factor